MTHHLKNGQEYLMVEVEDGAENFSLKMGYWGAQLLLYTYGEVKAFLRIGIGQWQILFLASEATEEQAGEVVGYYGNGMYRDYDLPDMFGYKRTALESLSSLLTSHGLSLNCIVLSKIK